MTDRSAKLRLGLFVAAAFVTLAGLVVLFGGSPRVFTPRAEYTIGFGEAPNVAPGVPVRKSGVRIGEVSGVDLDEKTGRVHVRVQVDKKYLPRLSDDATIFRGILNGDTSIDFVPKTGADGQPIPVRPEPIPPGTEIDGVTPINPGQLVRQAAGSLPNAQESMTRLLVSVQRFEQAVPRAEKAFDEIAGLARGGREFLPELRKTNEKVQEVLAFNDPKDEPGGLKTTLADLRDFLRTTKPLIEDLRRVIRTNEDDLAATVKATRKTTEGLADVLKPENRQAVDATLKNLQTASDDLTKAIRLAAIVLNQADVTLKDADVAFKSLDAAVRPLSGITTDFSRNASVATDQFAKAATELRETLRMINRADGTLQKVIADPSLYNNLNDSAAALTRTLMRAEKVAADLQVFADKIARRPESIGVGGAIRPNSGLKESPFAPSPPGPLPPVPPQTGGTSYRPPAEVPSDLPPKR